MVQGTRRTRFLLKPAQSILIDRESSRQNFDRNVATELAIACTIHFSHPACAKLRADFVTSEFCTRFNRHRSSDGGRKLVGPFRKRHGCRPMRRSRSTKRGSLRTDSKGGSHLILDNGPTRA